MGILFDKQTQAQPISAPVIDYGAALDAAVAGERHIQVAVHSGLAPSLAREFIAKCREMDAAVVAAISADGGPTTKAALVALVAEKAPPPFPAAAFVDKMIGAGGGTVAKLVSACKA